MPRYCPLGTPSLLDGDFWENAARLKDFSWSVLFSSISITTVFAEESSNFAVKCYNFANENSKFPEESFKFAEESSKILCLVQENPPGVYRLILPLIYFSVYIILCYALISCVKIKLTRNLVVNVDSFMTFLIISFTSILVFLRTVSIVHSYQFFVVNIHILLFSEAFVFKHCRLATLREEYKKFRNIPLRIAGAILAVLVFLFTPAIPHEHDECPDESLRFMSEVILWASFSLIFDCIRCIELTVSYHQLDVLYIWKYSGGIPYFWYRYKIVGEMKKKEGFGWITDYYSIDSKVNEKTALPLA